MLRIAALLLVLMTTLGFASERWTLPTTTSGGTDCSVTRDNTLWFPNAGVLDLGFGEWVHFDTTNVPYFGNWRGVYSEPQSDTVYIATIRGTILAGTQGMNIARVDRLPDTTLVLYDVIRDAAGVWWASTHRGLWRKGAQGWVEHMPISSFQDKPLYRLERTADTAIWVSTNAERDGGLLFRVKGTDVRRISVGTVRGFQAAPHAGKVFVGTYGPLQVVDAVSLAVTEIDHYDHLSPFGHTGGWTFGGWEDAGGNLYFGFPSRAIGIRSSTGVWAVDTGLATTSSNSFFAFLQTADNRLVACGTWTPALYRDTVPALPSQQVPVGAVPRAWAQAAQSPGARTLTPGWHSVGLVGAWRGELRNFQGQLVQRYQGVGSQRIALDRPGIWRQVAVRSEIF